ncbi:MAG: GNAT family N-acetyltransferase [Planctomycetes bacterium]|nr:GNAT family N-acetyltransferase [Planctomycetota bacterium]
MRDIRLTEPDCHDARILSELGSRTFIQAYGGALDPAQLAAYVGETFSHARMARELDDADIYYLLAYDQDRACAYAKLSRSAVPEALVLTRAVELKRLYVVPEYCGQGVGARLMEGLLAWTSRHAYPSLWLRVWQKNESAIRFYERRGFCQAGQEPYHVGDCSETVLLMVRSVPSVS